MVTDNQRRALPFRRLISAELGEQAGDRFAAGAHQLSDFFMSHRQPDPHSSIAHLAIGGRLKQESGKPL
jgi:hypothetical protein